MSDSIDRQAAIDAATYGNPQTAWQRIEALPSVQPERKKGKWIVHTTYLEHDCTIQYDVCSQCGKPKPRKLFDNDFSYGINYCVACGADMRGNKNEQLSR